METDSVVRRVPWSLYSVQIQESFLTVSHPGKSLGFSNLSFLIYKNGSKNKYSPIIIGSQKDEKIRQRASKILTS